MLDGERSYMQNKETGQRTRINYEEGQYVMRMWLPSKEAQEETEMSKRGIGDVAANGSSIKNYGEKKIVGYADDGGSVSMRAQCADVKKVLCSVHKMNLGGNVVVLDGGRSYMQNKETGQRTRINYEEGQCVMYMWLPSKEEEAQEETEQVLKGTRFAILATENDQVFSRRA